MAGVFKRVNGQWKDCNDDYSIKKAGYLTSNDPSQLPQIYIWNNGTRNFVYPLIKEADGPTDVFTLANASDCWMWQGGPYDKSIWGWANSGSPTVFNTAGQGYFGTGMYDWERDIHKMHAGWFNFTNAGLSSVGLVGLGKVKTVRKLTIILKHRAGTGAPSETRRLGIVATTVRNPDESSSTSPTINPTMEHNRSRVFESDNSTTLNAGADTEFVFTDGELMNYVKGIMNNNGTYRNLCTYNGKHPSVSPGNAFYYDGTYYFSKDYFRYNMAKIKVEYTYEP